MNGGQSISPSDDAASAAELPRSGRACLGCRKLKTRCDGAEEPPCKRCTAAGQDCVFVESKRGKRPPKKPEANLADKFRTIEGTLALVLESMNSGAPPDPGVLQKLQKTLSDGLAPPPAIPKAEEEKEDDRKKEVYRVARSRSPSSPADDDDSRGGGGRRNSKRSRTATTTTASDIATGSPPFSNSKSPVMNRTSLALLADASLAAEIDGRSTITPLDAKFNLSSVTDAIQNKDEWEDAQEGKTPALLSKGIVTAETAVELFRVFFDYAYIHLPLLDPAYTTALSVCTRSSFLFTVICAVASRFHSDPTLHTKCYAEAHSSFLEVMGSEERNIEAVQACMLLTCWGSAPQGSEDRPRRAWLYFGTAVRMGLELGLFRPAGFVDVHLSTAGNATKANPWANLPSTVSEEEQRAALNRERTWLLAFVIDRNMSAVMGRPYQIQEARSLLIPLHPMSLPFDLGVVAHLELQIIIGQVMDTFRDRIYGLSSASDEMPSPVVMKLFNSRMDEWRQRWCPVPGEPIANNLLFYFYSSKLFLNTFPLQTMLRVGDSVEDPECVSTTISAAKSILDLGHEYAKLGVLRHCPDVNFLFMLHAGVFLAKVKASNTRFADLVSPAELYSALSRSISDCDEATCSQKHAASTCSFMLRALMNSSLKMSNPPPAADPPASSPDGLQLDPALAFSSANSFGSTLAPAGLISPAPYAFLSSPFGGSGTHTPVYGSGTAPSEFDAFLSDTNFFNSMLVSQGTDGFFAWDLGLDAAAGMAKPLEDGTNGM